MLIGFDANISTRDSAVGAGENSNSDNGNSWLGPGGVYQNTFVNNTGQDLTLVVWGQGYSAAFVEINPPSINVPLKSGDNLTVSFAEGASGAWSALYNDTGLRLGMINNTMGEFTFKSSNGSYDVSRKPNTSGHDMTIIGPDCTASFDNCVFLCIDPTAANCYEAGSYELVNCTGPYTQNGLNDGQPSGGCTWAGVGVSLVTYLRV